MEKTKDARIKKEHSRLKNLFSHLNEHRMEKVNLVKEWKNGGTIKH